MCFEVKTIIKNCHCKKFTQGGLSTEGAQNGFLSGGFKMFQNVSIEPSRSEKNLLGPSRGVRGHAPWKVFKMEPFKLAKNAFPAYS